MDFFVPLVLTLNHRYQNHEKLDYCGPRCSFFSQQVLGLEITTLNGQKIVTSPVQHEPLSYHTLQCCTR